MESDPAIIAHCVTYESGAAVVDAVDSILSQLEVPGLRVEVTDNCSVHSPIAALRARFGARVGLYQNPQNMGFCAAHNQAAQRVLASGAKYLLLFNPDLRLEAGALNLMLAALSRDSSWGMATPLIFRADEALKPLSPALIDAAGMKMTCALRHLDRGSGQLDQPRYHEAREVFGGTGACLLLKRECIEDLIIECGAHDEALFEIYPQLSQTRETRAALFDEAFFAYREDADLAWRAQLLGWRTCFVPDAIAYHTRRVVPERRADLPAEINRLSVRNRFLMQFNNLSWDVGLKSLLGGAVFWNLVVLLGVLLRERTSLRALSQAIRLFPRACQRRKVVQAKARARGVDIAKWFE